MAASIGLQADYYGPIFPLADEAVVPPKNHLAPLQ